MTTQFFQRDANHVPITNLGLTETKTITYVAGTTGAIATTTLFTVTGTVAINVFGICTTDLTSGGASTIEVGTATSTACLADQVTSTTIDNHEVYHDAVLAVGGQVAGHTHVVDEDVIQTVAAATITAGVIQWYCTWTPLSEDGNVVAT